MEQVCLTRTLSEQENPAGRLFFLDNLRSFIVLLVVVFHAGLAYMIYVPEWWYVIDRQKHLAFDIFVIATDVFIMPVMFFIAGFFAIRSIAHRGYLAFWKDKLYRIVIPWVVGVIFIAPGVTYIIFLSRTNAPPEYFYYWFNIFFGKAYQQAQYWFLGVLAFFFLALTVISYWHKPLVQLNDKPSVPSYGFFILFGLTTSVVFFGVNLLVDDNAWMPVHVLLIQPTRCTLYVFYFSLGVYAYRQQWFSSGGYAPVTRYWVPLSVALLFFYIGFKLMPGTKDGMMLRMAANSLMHAYFCLSSVFALIALFHKGANCTSPILGRLAANSYAIYYIHTLVVYPLNLIVRDLQWNVFIKYFVVAGSSVIVCCLACEFGVSKISAFSGMEQRRAALKASLKK